MRFELTVKNTPHNGFRDRPIQPLWHLSKRTVNFDILPEKFEIGEIGDLAITKVPNDSIPNLQSLIFLAYIEVAHVLQRATGAFGAASVADLAAMADDIDVEWASLTGWAQLFHEQVGVVGVHFFATQA